MKSANVQISESESSLYRKYQELTGQVQEKDAVIKKLEMQLEQQVWMEKPDKKERDPFLFMTCMLNLFFFCHRSYSEPRKLKLLRKKLPRLKTGSRLNSER